jgi:hypothetical protein
MYDEDEDKWANEDKWIDEDKSLYILRAHDTR